MPSQQLHAVARPHLSFLSMPLYELECMHAYIIIHLKSCVMLANAIMQRSCCHLMRLASTLHTAANPAGQIGDVVVRHGQCNTPACQVAAQQAAQLRVEELF